MFTSKQFAVVVVFYFILQINTSGINYPERDAQQLGACKREREGSCGESAEAALHESCSTLHCVHFSDTLRLALSTLIKVWPSDRQADRPTDRSGSHVNPQCYLFMIFYYSTDDKLGEMAKSEPGQPHTPIPIPSPIPSPNPIPSPWLWKVLSGIRCGRHTWFLGMKMTTGWAEIK